RTALCADRQARAAVRRPASARKRRTCRSGARYRRRDARAAVARAARRPAPEAAHAVGQGWRAQFASGATTSRAGTRCAQEEMIDGPERPFRDVKKLAIKSL